MARQKNANDLDGIMSDQLDVLTSGGVTQDALHVAEAIANMIGKGLKLAALRIQYAEYRKQGGAIIETLEGQNK